jgi:2-polyprenyl-3-methyl-5-hydroxy-6-metoxy-1,4-benzoquinol methylase
MGDQPRCWCGSVDLTTFSPDYFVCGACRTLVARAMPGPEIGRVIDEELDFYGRHYWFEYQEHQLGTPDITVRARADLPERCVYWLRTLLRYRIPPGRTLDVGCGHGAFVMLLARAGFDAAGLELSPWVVDFARRTFGVPVLQGPLEAQGLPAGSLDGITMMDVLEHLVDPEATLRTALSALAEDGVLLIQTPAAPAGMTWEEMVETKHPFLPLMAERGHLYLFNPGSLRQLLEERLGIAHVRFEPAYFGEYDMFAVASQRPLACQKPAAVEEALDATADGRLVHALLEIENRWSALYARYENVERDRAARLVALLDRGERLAGIEGERNMLSAELQNFRGHLAVAEADRAARLAVIREQAERLAAAEADRAARLAVIEELSERLTASEKDRADRLALIEELSERLAASEKDRADRLALIEELSERLAAAEKDRTDRLAVIETLGARLAAAEAERGAQATTLAQLEARLHEREREALQQAARLQELATEREAARAERDALRAELSSLRFAKVRRVVRDLIRRSRPAFRH